MSLLFFLNTIRAYYTLLYTHYCTVSHPIMANSRRRIQQICWQVWEGEEGGLRRQGGWHGWDICLLSTQASAALHRADMLRGATCGVILAAHSSPANLNLVQDLSPNELPLPLETARLLVRVGFLQNQFWNYPTCKVVAFLDYICPSAGCYLSEVPASDVETVFERSEGWLHVRGRRGRGSVLSTIIQSEGDKWFSTEWQIVIIQRRNSSSPDGLSSSQSSPSSSWLRWSGD